MAYAAAADESLSRVGAPGVLALQRALVWLVGASVAIVFIEPSPYELVTLLAAPVVFTWIATSWYMAFTVMFLAMVLSEDTTARLDMLRRGLTVGAMVAASAGIAGY